MTTTTGNLQQENQRLLKAIVLPSSTTTLKFVCDICGFLCTDMENLKAHLALHHNEKNERTVIKMASTSTAPALVAASGKILIANKPAAAAAGLSMLSHHAAAVINLPQSMTVLNLKEVSSKLQSAAESPSPVAESQESSGADVKLLVNRASCSSASLSDYSSSNSPISSMSSSSSGLSIFSPATAAANSPPTHLGLPYHYSESENIYLCNLCNCNYDSLRSIKAHLWKHSGHHELSYPTSSSESNAKATTKATSFIQNDAAAAAALVNGNFKRHVTLQLPASTKTQLQSSLNFKSRPDGSSDLFDSSLNYSTLMSCNESRQGRDEQMEAAQGKEMSPSGESSSNHTAADANNAGPRRAASRGGICSVLLEVVEKLHDEEESHQNDENNNHVVAAADDSPASVDDSRQKATSPASCGDKPAAGKKRNSRRTTGKTRHIRDLLNQQQQQEMAMEETSMVAACAEAAAAVVVAASKSASSKKKRKDAATTRKAVPVKSPNDDEGSSANEIFVHKKMRLSSDQEPAAVKGEADENECKIETTIVTSIYEDVATIQKEQEEEDDEYAAADDQKLRDTVGLNLLVRTYLQANLSEAN